MPRQKRQIEQQWVFGLLVVGGLYAAYAYNDEVMEFYDKLVGGEDGEEMTLPDDSDSSEVVEESTDSSEQSDESTE